MAVHRGTARISGKIRNLAREAVYTKARSVVDALRPWGKRSLCQPANQVGGTRA